MNSCLKNKVVPYSVYEYAYSNNKSKVYPNNYVVFDTETTGLEPGLDRIIEISAIKYINGKKVDVFSQLINPREMISPFITHLTGITNKDLVNKPTIDKVLPLFFNFIEDFVLVAHNTPYDIKMIAGECFRCNINMCNNKLIDTVPLSRRMIDKSEVSNHKLSTLKDYFGINLVSHRATEDCQMCNLVYQLYLKYESLKIKNKKISKIDNQIYLINLEDGDTYDLSNILKIEDSPITKNNGLNDSNKLEKNSNQPTHNIPISSIVTIILGIILFFILIGIIQSIPTLEVPLTALLPILFLSLFIIAIISFNIEIFFKVKKDVKKIFNGLALGTFILGLIICLLTPFINRIIG